MLGTVPVDAPPCWGVKGKARSLWMLLRAYGGPRWWVDAPPSSCSVWWSPRVGGCSSEPGLKKKKKCGSSEHEWDNVWGV